MPTEAGLMRFEGTVIPLLGVLLASYLWKKPLEKQDPFYSKQAWSLRLAVAYLLLLFGIEFVVDSLLLDRDVTYVYRLSAWLGTHVLSLLWIMLFFRFVGQSVAVVGLDKSSLGSGVSRGAMWVLGVLCLSWLLMAAAGKKNWPNAAMDQQAVASYATLYSRNPGWSAVFYWSQSMWMAVFVGITEELAYRGILYGALRKHVYAPAAKTISALCFAAAHGGLNPGHFLFG